MANFNEALRWTNGSPPIYVTVSYSKRRNGADMIYNVSLSISTVTGSSSFGYPIYADLYINGSTTAQFQPTLKNASPSRWSSPITYSTGEFTVANKTTGTTHLMLDLSSAQGSTRWQRWEFDMAIDPANFSSTPTLTFKSKTETSITYNWSTSETCDNIVWHGTGTTSTTGVEGRSGTVTFSGLTANTSYSHYGTFRRKDSGLTTNSNTATTSTDNYPYVSSLTPQVITLGNTNIQTVNISNPHNRQTTVYVRTNNINGTLIGSATTTGTTATITIPTNDLYQLIPAAREGTLYYYCVYSGHTTTGITGKYQISGNERPTFPTSSWSYVADLTSLTNNNQVVIDGYSTISVTIDTPATSDYHANILNYYATWGNATPVTFNANQTAQLVQGNGSSLVVLANDSRQLQSNPATSTKDLSANRIVYNKPVVNNSETHRVNGVDTTVILNANGTMFKDKFGANGVQNAIHLAQYRVKTTDSANWSQAYPISLNNCVFDSSTGQWAISNASIHQNGSSGGFPSGTAYDVKLEFYDAQGLLGFGTYVSTVEDGTLARDVYKDSDGEYHEGINGLADSNYTQKINGNLNVTNGITGNLTGTSSNVTQKKSLSSKSHSNWGTNNGYVPDMSFIAYWNGAYSSNNASNLTYAHQGTIQCKPTNLYNNTSGTTGTVSLSQTSANFSYIDIWFQGGNGTLDCVRVFSPNGKGANLFSGNSNGTIIWLQFNVVRISGTSITRENMNECSFSHGGTANIYNVSNIKIMRVDGWK